MRKVENSSVISMAKEIERHSRHMPAALAVEKACKGKSDALSLCLERFLRRHMLGSGICNVQKSNAYLSQLFDVLQANMEVGSSIGKRLSLLIERMENAEILSNKIRAKTAGNSLLTYIGIVFFFPLFSGISAGITQSQLAHFANHAVSSFLPLVMAYSFAMLYISYSFAHPDSRFEKRIAYALSSAFVSGSVFSAAYFLVNFAI